MCADPRTNIVDHGDWELIESDFKCCMDEALPEVTIGNERLSLVSLTREFFTRTERRGVSRITMTGYFVSDQANLEKEAELRIFKYEYEENALYKWVPRFIRMNRTRFFEREL